jgi:hypothetical protein
MMPSLVRFVPVLPEECAWTMRLDVEDLRRNPIVDTDIGDVVGATPDGRVAHFKAWEWDLLWSPAASVA